MPKSFMKRFRQKKDAKIRKAIHRLQKEIQKPGTHGKITKIMSKRNEVMPEHYNGALRWRNTYVVDNACISGINAFTFLVCPQNYGCPGINNTNSVANQPNTLNYNVVNVAGLFNNNFWLPGANAKGSALGSTNTRGHTDLSSFYGLTKPYKSNLKFTAVSSSANEGLLTLISAVPLWFTGAGLYSTDGCPTNSLWDQRDMAYTKYRDFTTYEAGRKPLSLSVDHAQFAGVSKETFMNETMRGYVENGVQPQSQSSAAIFPAYQVTVMTADATHFTGNIMLDLNMTVYSQYENLSNYAVGN